MAMSVSTLESELAAIDPEETEAAAVVNMSTAYSNYAKGAAAGPTISAAAVAAGKAAMASALAGMSASGAGLSKVPAGLTAFWTAVVGLGPGAFTAATAIVPPTGLAGFSSAFGALMAANTAGSKSKADAMKALATVMHTASQGGSATFPGPVTTPIT